MAGRVILIFGPPAVGKSTISAALQRRLSADGTLWLRLDYDRVAAGMPAHWVAGGGREGRFADKGYRFSSLDGATTRTVGEDARQVQAAFHRMVAAAATSGIDVIAESAVTDAEDDADWDAALAGLTVLRVALEAPIGALEVREAADATRALQGLARGTADGYAAEANLRLNTSVVSPDEAAEAIAGRL